MPIQFPKPAGPGNLFAERQFRAFCTKAFDVVPAPNMGRIGAPLSYSTQLGKGGWSLNPGSPLRWDGTKCGAGGAAGNVRRPNTMFQDPAQTAIVNDARLVTEMYDNVNGFDRLIGEANNRIIGVSRDATGVALGTCVVKVFRTADDTLVASTISDGSGNWTAYPNAQGPYYFVEYKAGSPDVFGTSPNTNTSTPYQPGG
jgi:hypothetical protein